MFEHTETLNCIVTVFWLAKVLMWLLDYRELPASPLLIHRYKCIDSRIKGIIMFARNHFLELDKMLIDDGLDKFVKYP